MTNEQFKIAKFLIERIQANQDTLGKLKCAQKNAQDDGCCISITNKNGMERGHISSLRGSHALNRNQVLNMINGMIFYIKEQIKTDQYELGEL